MATRGLGTRLHGATTEREAGGTMGQSEFGFKFGRHSSSVLGHAMLVLVSFGGFRA